MTYKNTLISFIIIAIVGLAAWTTIITYRPHSLAALKSEPAPDAIMEDVVALIIDKTGKPSMKVITPRLIHYTESDTTHLTTPQLVLYRKSPQPWYVSSRFAKATQGIENVNFWENVTIHHAADNNNPATLIKTTTLTVHPNQKTAETQDFITLIQPNMVVKATGMHADMNTGNIKLLSKARGEYVPSS